MPPSDAFRSASDRRQRRLLSLLAMGLVAFGTAAAALFYLLQPETFRIAVGPSGSEDYHVDEAMAEAFEEESRTVRILPITTAGAAESLALMCGGKTDLAVGRGDLAMPADAQTLAVLRKNHVVIWSPSGRAGKDSKKKAVAKINEIGDLAGHKVGIIGQTGANVALLRAILEVCILKTSSRVDDVTESA
jgi:TRAP-type uncharacterized transport system substrate-binding protein